MTCSSALSATCNKPEHHTMLVRPACDGIGRRRLHDAVGLEEQILSVWDKRGSLIERTITRQLLKLATAGRQRHSADACAGGFERMGGMTQIVCGGAGQRLAH